MLFLALFLLALTSFFLWDYLIRKRRNDMLHYMPGPRPLPLLGNILMYRGMDAEKIMEFVHSNRRKYGPLYRVWIFNQLAIFSTDPRDIEIVLSSQQLITKNNLYQLLHCWLGTGLLMSTGKKWHSRRKIITPTFHFKILEQFVEIFDQQSTIMVEQLRERADGRTAINVYPVICLAALDIIAETAMGTKIHAQMNSQLPYVQAVTEVTNIMTARFINAWERIDWLFRLLKPGMARKQDAAIKCMHDFTENIIEQRRQKLINSGHSQEETNDLGQKRRMALLDVLLQSNVDGQPLSNVDIREEVDTFMFEGHDTTTSAISYCLYEISRHSKVQQQLVQEIEEVLGTDPKRSMNLRDLGELKYMECVIKESLRLHPPVPMIGRYFNEDVEIRGKRIPAGTNYTVGIYVLLRDPDYFDSPNEFQPERFTNDQAQKHPYAYIPFSAGPRNCIGQKFAILEMKSTISKILRNYELLPIGPDPISVMNLVLRSANGVHLGLRPR